MASMGKNNCEDGQNIYTADDSLLLAPPKTLPKGMSVPQQVVSHKYFQKSIPATPLTHLTSSGRAHKSSGTPVRFSSHLSG